MVVRGYDRVMTTMDAAIRLVVAALLTGIVGFEREWSHHGAGLRTHMVVGLGSALFAIAGSELGDSRVAAQIVTGIGFLGAGAILRNGTDIRGLTTAAGLWAAAAIGLTAGIGSVRLATVAAVVLVVVLLVLRPLEAVVNGRHRRPEVDPPEDPEPE